MSADKNRNRHRAGKRQFQVMLKPNVAEILDDVKLARGINTNSQLLIDLLMEEYDRIKFYKNN